MSKYYVIHGSVALGTGKGDEAERKTYAMGESFDADDADVKDLLAAGTIGKGSKPAKDGATDEETRAAEAAAARHAAATAEPSKPHTGHR